MKLSFVIPSLNEKDGIRATINRIPLQAIRDAGHEVELLVVDGASKDGTADVARSLGAKVHSEPRLGYGRAYKTGFALAKGDILITGDADGSYPFEDTLEFLRMLEAGRLDFLTVNRFGHLEPGSMSTKHKIGNAILSTTGRILFRVRIADSQSGMWFLRRRAVESLPIDDFHDGMPFSEELKIRAFKHPDLSAREVPGRYKPRTGEAKLSSWKDGWRNLRWLLRLRFKRLKPRRAA